MDATTERPTTAEVRTLRPLAVLVALVAGTLRLGLELWGLTTIPDGTAVWPSVTVLVGSVVPLAGAALLSRGDERGTGVLAVTGAFTIPALIGSGWWLLAGGPLQSRLWLLSLIALLVAAVLAWMSRDPARWRLTAPRGGAPYWAAAAAVVLGTSFPPTAFAARPIAGARWWEPLLFGEHLDLAAIASFALVPLLVAGVLWTGARLPRSLAAGVVGALAVAGVASAVGNLLTAATSAEVWFTPVGWLDLAGHLALFVLAIRWWSPADDRVAAP